VDRDPGNCYQRDGRLSCKNEKVEDFFAQAGFIHWLFGAKRQVISIFHATAAPGADSVIHEGVIGAGSFFDRPGGFNLKWGGFTLFQREISAC
jgi:hypothetical protein